MKTLLITLALVASLQAAPERYSFYRIPSIPAVVIPTPTPKPTPAPVVTVTHPQGLTVKEITTLFRIESLNLSNTASVLSFWGPTKGSEYMRGKSDAYFAAYKLMLNEFGEETY